jgi:hypothetical protein
MAGAAKNEAENINQIFVLVSSAEKKITVNEQTPGKLF